MTGDEFYDYDSPEFDNYEDIDKEYEEEFKSLHIDEIGKSSSEKEISKDELEEIIEEYEEYLEDDSDNV